MKKINLKDPVPDVTIKNLWQYNHSMLFILPLFDGLSTGTKTIPHINYPIIQMCLDNGLVNTYLEYPGYNTKASKDKYLHLEFDSNIVTSSNSVIKSSVADFSTHIISCEHFVTVRSFEDVNKTIFTLSIPPEFAIDVNLAIMGQYSKMSKEYKEKVRLTQSDIPFTENRIGVYISINNIPYSIVTKAEFFKSEMERIVGDMDDNVEYYSKFNLDKEIYKLEYT